MINLNDIQYENDNQVIKATILDQYSEEEIFTYYLGPFKIGKPFSSPFRSDNHFSFSIFVGKDTGAILYNEMLYKEIGNCFKLVKNLYGLASYRDVYLKIAADLNILDIKGLSFNKAKQYRRIKKAPSKPNNLEIGIKYRNWNYSDKSFWKQFNISKKTLLEYNVKPISYVFYNGFSVPCDPLAYALKEIKDNKITFKIYQPLNDKYKWSNNHDSSVWQGWTQLKNNDVLIITSSLKDVMCIKDTLGYNAVALQAETTKPKDHIIDELKSRFKKIYVFYDNDCGKEENWGQKYAKELCDSYGFNNLCIPKEYKTKDFSDMIKEHGVQKSKQWANSILNVKP